MQWQKLGQIFKFADTPFAERFIGFAKSPQAVVFDDFVRVYFSACARDGEKLRSVPQWVDFDKGFKNIINYSKGEILPLGKLGTFDEHGIFPFSPAVVDGKLCAYTSGWTRRVSVDVDAEIGFVVSEDNGDTFKRLGDGPVLSSSLYEPFLVGDAFVRKFGALYYMFYIYGTKWSDTATPERVYKIAYATSTDGINWNRNGRLVIPDSIGENECQALPTVIEINGRYHMYFCYRDMEGFRTEDGKGYRIGYAYSNDLENWTRDDAAAGIDMSDDGWDSKMLCYPNLFEMNNDIYMLYNGNDFAREGFGLAKLVEV